MNIELTKKEFRRLLDMVYIGNWILNSTRGDDRIEDYDNLESKLFALCRQTGMTPGTYVKLDEPTTVKINGEDVTFDENTWYGAIVQAQLDADGFPVTVWDAKNDTTDGWDAWYNPELAAQELALAVEDLAKLGYEVSKENPIVIDYPYPSYNEVGQNQAYVLKTCIEGALGGLVRFDALPLNNVTEFLNVENNTNSGAEHNTDMGPALLPAPAQRQKLHALFHRRHAPVAVQPDQRRRFRAPQSVLSQGGYPKGAAHGHQPEVLHQRL